MENRDGWRWVNKQDIAGTAELEGEERAAKLTGMCVSIDSVTHQLTSILGQSLANLKYEVGTNKAVLAGWSTMELHARSANGWDERSSQ